MSTTVKKEVISWVKTILLAAVLAGLVNSFLIVNAEVPTGSMENTIMAGDRILALRTSYWFDEPEAGDIVVFRYPDDETGKTLYVKRIIGTPGDTVEMSNGTVYVNGKARAGGLHRRGDTGQLRPLYCTRWLLFHDGG